MATLKDHQQAMVDLLTSGSGIPASASRLAHAMHDVLVALTSDVAVMAWEERCERRLDATTPGLNDKALSKPQKALKTDSPARWPTPAEQRVKELENTIRQLKAQVSHLRGVRYHMATKIADLQSIIDRVKEADAVRLRQSNCIHNFTYRSGASASHCLKCGIGESLEQAGCRKDDTQVCEHEHTSVRLDNSVSCDSCGAVL